MCEDYRGQAAISPKIIKNFQNSPEKLAKKLAEKLLYIKNRFLITST